MVDSFEIVVFEMQKHDEYGDISEEIKRMQYSEDTATRDTSEL